MEENEKREFQVGQNKCVVRVLSNGEKQMVQSFIDGKPYETIKADQLEKVAFAIEQVIAKISITAKIDIATSIEQNLNH